MYVASEKQIYGRNIQCPGEYFGKVYFVFYY